MFWIATCTKLKLSFVLPQRLGLCQMAENVDEPANVAYTEHFIFLLSC